MTRTDGAASVVRPWRYLRPVTNKAKQIGTRWESEVVAYLQDHGHPHAERRALAGAEDRGDITGVPGVMIECKSLKSITLSTIADEVEVQTRNAGAKVGAAFIKRRGKGAEGAYVVMSPATFLELLG